MKSMAMRAAILAAMTMASPALAANPEDAALNAVYDRLATARSANDVPGMAAAFSSGGILIDARPGPAVSGADLAARLQPQAERVIADKAQMQTQYRVERRSVMGDLAVDAGFMRLHMTRPGAEPMVRHARFLVTMRRDADGVWRIVGDASMQSSEEAWNSVAPVEGLKHDG